ncbi:MAG: hypothetical protein Q8O67_00335 [Deltaproteobacteria bacterium]|nr:hypothetical protein [Deltaproteobacteria bacterium]
MAPVPDPKPSPTDEARARLRDEAAALDVEDIVDLCCSRSHDRLRVSLYLEALRAAPAGRGEKAQVAACLLCFDLARHGDEARELELQLLLPVVDSLALAPGTAVSALTDKSEAVAQLWRELVDHAAHRDLRTAPPVPDDDSIELALFDPAELQEIELWVEDFAIDGPASAADEFDSSIEALWAPLSPAGGGSGLPLFASEDRADIERVEQLKRSALSFASSVPVAAELHALSALFLASHMRSKGLFGRRNKQRDRLVVEALEAFVRLPAPPTEAAGWFAAGDIRGSAPFAWEKMAEVLIDFVGFTGKAIEDGALDPSLSGFVENVVDGYIKDARSAKVPALLAAPGVSRRR